MNPAVSFSERLSSKIGDARAIKTFVDNLISQQDKNKCSSIYEINHSPNWYFIYARFANLESFKKNLEVGCCSVASEMLETLSIKRDIP